VSSRSLSLALLVALTACATRDTPGHGGVLVIATPGAADVLLPPVTSTTVGRQVTDNIFPRLAELTLALNTLDDSGFAPSLATRWEHPDSLTLVFHLDPRARWQDGVPVTAGDVAYTFRVYTDTAVGSVYASNLAPIASVTARDSLTAVFRFRRWYPEQLYDATYHMRILPRHLLDTIPTARLATSSFAQAPIGVGPFRFVRWTPEDVVIAADSTYYGARPHLSQIVWRIMPDVSTAVSALISGDADAIEAIPQRDELARAAQDTNLALVPYPSPYLMFVAFNLRRPPFSDRALRRALAMAVDRATIAHAVFGDSAIVPVGATSEMQWTSHGHIRQIGYDTAAAARALDSLGWRRGPDGMRARQGRPLRFTLLVPTSSQVRQQGAVLLQGQLAAAGVDMRIDPVDYSILGQRATRGDFDAVFWSSTLDASPSALVGDWTAASEQRGGDFGAYDSPAFDSLVAAAVVAPTRGRAAPLYDAALSRLNDDAPALFLFAPRNTAVIQKRFTHVSIRPDNWLRTVAEWSVPPDRQLPRDRPVAPAAR